MMMIDRRSALAGIAATAAAATMPAPANAKQGAAALPATDVAVPPRGPRMNMARAYEIMERQGIDALVLGEGLNFYHASGYWPVTTRMGHAPSNFVIVSRNDSQPLAMVLASFTYYYLLADVHRPEDFPTYLYTAPSGDTGPDGQPQAAPVSVFRDRKEVPLDDIEARRGSLALMAAREVGASAGARHALARALNDAGLIRGTLACDHPTVRRLLEEAAPGATLVEADDALRRIRPVKSELEIALMRQAATANAEAALAAVRMVREGATHHELRNAFWAEAARRGNHGVFMVIDRVSAEGFDAPFRDGQAFLIDAVSEYQGYHGDYGRTVFIGEPSRPMAKATKAVGAAWNEVRAAMKPGMRFSQISALGQETLRKMGADYTVSFTPHSVGLYHTDHVGMAGAAASREDLVLEKGMILSVDCPLLEAGVGGSAHLEDLTLITATGSESINNTSDQTIIV
jgi:Xaa-Pro aminopeptidase